MFLSKVVFFVSIFLSLINIGSSFPFGNTTTSISSANEIDLSIADPTFFANKDEAYFESLGLKEIIHIFKSLFSKKSIENAFNIGNIEEEIDEKGNIIIDLTNQFEWLHRLVPGGFNIEQIEARYDQMQKRHESTVEGYDTLDDLEVKFAKLKSNDIKDEAEKSNFYAQTILKRPRCDEIDEDTWIGMCRENAFKHKLVNCSRRRPHVLRGILIPSISWTLWELINLTNVQVCEKTKFPKYFSILRNPICTSFALTKKAVRHMSIALMINGFSDITGSAFAPHIPSIQKMLSMVGQEYKGYNCIGFDGKSVPIDEVTDELDIRYIGGKVEDPMKKQDFLNTYEFGLFPGNTAGDIGYVELTINATWPYDMFGYRFSYKHVGNLDVDLLNYYASTLPITTLISRLFKDTAQYNKIMLEGIVKDTKFGYIKETGEINNDFSAKNEEDDKEHWILAPVSKLYLNHRLTLFVFNNVVHTCDREEPMSLNIELPS